MFGVAELPVPLPGVELDGVTGFDGDAGVLDEGVVVVVPVPVEVPVPRIDPEAAPDPIEPVPDPIDPLPDPIEPVPAPIEPREPYVPPPMSAGRTRLGGATCDDAAPAALAAAYVEAAERFFCSEF